LKSIANRLQKVFAADERVSEERKGSYHGIEQIFEPQVRHHQKGNALVLHLRVLRQKLLIL
jgi:hypothetical protein